MRLCPHQNHTHKCYIVCAIVQGEDQLCFVAQFTGMCSSPWLPDYRVAINSHLNHFMPRSPLPQGCKPLWLAVAVKLCSQIFPD